MPGRAVTKVNLSLETGLNLFGIGNEETQALFARLHQRFALVLWDMPPPTLSPVSMIAASCMDVWCWSSKPTRHDGRWRSMWLAA